MKDRQRLTEQREGDTKMNSKDHGWEGRRHSFDCVGPEGQAVVGFSRETLSRVLSLPLSAPHGLCVMVGDVGGLNKKYR